MRSSTRSYASPRFDATPGRIIELRPFLRSVHLQKLAIVSGHLC
jgi:hypothetical protein